VGTVICLFLTTCARLSWSHSAFWVHVKLFFRIISYTSVYWSLWELDTVYRPATPVHRQRCDCGRCPHDSTSTQDSTDQARSGSDLYTQGPEWTCSRMRSLQISQIKWSDISDNTWNIKTNKYWATLEYTPRQETRCATRTSNNAPYNSSFWRAFKKLCKQPDS